MKTISTLIFAPIHTLIFAPIPGNYGFVFDTLNLDEFLTLKAVITDG